MGAILSDKGDSDELYKVYVMGIYSFSFDP